jgi:hypothetical protein
LSSLKGYLPNVTLNSETNVTYDNSNRIIQIVRSEENATYFTVTIFTHNVDNKITSDSNSSGNRWTKTFNINSNGIIDKDNFNVTTSIQYDNHKPITSTSFSTPTIIRIKKMAHCHLCFKVFLDL